MYRAGRVPVGADQVSHVEITREVARRFNHIYGREPGFEEQAEGAIVKMGKKNAKLYRTLKKRYQEEGDMEAWKRRGHCSRSSRTSPWAIVSGCTVISKVAVR